MTNFHFFPSPFRFVKWIEPTNLFIFSSLIPPFWKKKRFLFGILKKLKEKWARFGMRLWRSAVKHSSAFYGYGSNIITRSDHVSNDVWRARNLSASYIYFLYIYMYMPLELSSRTLDPSIFPRCDRVPNHPLVYVGIFHAVERMRLGSATANRGRSALRSITDPGDAGDMAIL